MGTTATAGTRPRRRKVLAGWVQPSPAVSRSVASAVVVGALGVSGCTPPPGEQPVPAAKYSPIHVGENVLVSVARPGWEHTEYMADADPRNPDRAMVCTMLFSPEQNRVTSGVYVTINGGATWDFTEDEMSAANGSVWDPACAYGHDGEAYFLTLTRSEAEPARGDYFTYEGWSTVGPAHLPLYRSDDGGVTWDGPLKLGFIDNADITVDRTGGPFRGRIYVYGAVTSLRDLWLTYSDDGGNSFVQSPQSPVTGYDAWHAGPGTILADSTLLLSYLLVKRDDVRAMDGYYTLAVAASHDGGRTIGTPVEVDSLASCMTYRQSSEGPQFARSGVVIPGLASDHSGGVFQGRAYVVWGERFRGHCSVFVARSEDGGASWSRPVKVSDERPRPEPDAGPDVFLPTITVNRDGVVGVSWYDRREDLDNRDHRLRFSASLDGGESWVPSVPVSTSPFTFAAVPEYPVGASVSGGGRRLSANRTDTFQVRVWPGARLYDGWNSGMGDYAGIAASADGRFRAFWIDNRTGIAQMYTAEITVDGLPTRHGSAELDDLENVTAFLELDYISSVWDPDSHTVKLEYRLLNTSEEVIVGPLKLRIKQLDSDLGVAELLRADGSSGGPGTVIDISVAIDGGDLLPGDWTLPARLEVRIDPIDNVLRSVLARDVVRFDVQAYARRERDR